MDGGWVRKTLGDSRVAKNLKVGGRRKRNMRQMYRQDIFDVPKDVI